MHRNNSIIVFEYLIAFSTKKHATYIYFVTQLHTVYIQVTIYTNILEIVEHF